MPDVNLVAKSKDHSMLCVRSCAAINNQYDTMHDESDVNADIDKTDAIICSGSTPDYLLID